MPSVGRPLAAVTFDFWNTIVEVSGNEETLLRRAEGWIEVLTGAGLDAPETGAAAAAVRSMAEVHARNWRQGRLTTIEEAIPTALPQLGLDPTAVPAEVLAQLADRYKAPTPDHLPPLCPNIEAALRDLRDAGLRIGIVCDVGFIPSPLLRGYLERHGLLGCFDHWSFSDEVGVYKPDARIFEHALAGLGGIDPGAAAHVGDLRRTDIAGAQAMGMVAVRYRGVNDDPGDATDGTGDVEGDLVLDDHADLPAALLG